MMEIQIEATAENKIGILIQETELKCQFKL